MSRFVAESFINDFGQVIQPGDEVIYAGTSWQRTKFRRGKFAGVYKSLKRGAYNYETKTYGDLEECVVGVKITDVPDIKSTYQRDTRTWSKKEVRRCAILPLCRVFKLDMTMMDLVNNGSYF